MDRELNELAGELNDYAVLGPDEYGEYLTALVGLAMQEGLMNFDFCEAVRGEMRAQLEWLKSNCEIVETTQTYKRSRKVLRFNDPALED
jgi:hypothetical protein